MTFGQYVVLALLPLAFPSGVWLLKLWLVERYVFLYGDKSITGNYVMIRLDKLSGAVDAFNWAGWVRVKPRSGYPGKEMPDDPEPK